MDSVLLKEGNISLVNGTRLKDRYLILFMNALLICKPFRTKLILDSGYLVSELEMKNPNLNETQKTLKNIIELYIISENLAPLTFSASTEQDQLQWMSVFETAFKAYYENKEVPEKAQQMAEVEKNLRSLRSKSLRDRSTINRNSYINAKKKTNSISLENLLELEGIKNSVKKVFLR